MRLASSISCFFVGGSTVFLRLYGALDDCDWLLFAMLGLDEGGAAPALGGLALTLARAAPAPAPAPPAAVAEVLTPAACEDAAAGRLLDEEPRPTAEEDDGRVLVIVVSPASRPFAAAADEVETMRNGGEISFPPSPAGAAPLLEVVAARRAAAAAAVRGEGPEEMMTTSLPLALLTLLLLLLLAPLLSPMTIGSLCVPAARLSSCPNARRCEPGAAFGLTLVEKRFAASGALVLAPVLVLPPLLVLVPGSCELLDASVRRNVWEGAFLMIAGAAAGLGTGSIFILRKADDAAGALESIRD